MKDEFINENMLKILIEQKKYIEAYRIYKELLKTDAIADISAYKSFIEEVKKIDPVLTMDRKTKEKKIFRLTTILNRIRRDSRPKREKKERGIKDTLITGLSVKTEISVKPVSDKIDNERGKIPLSSEKPMDIIQAIEVFTTQSISSVMNIIIGNFSDNILSKKPISNRIEILKEMLRKIETIKNQRKKESLNV